MRVKAHRNQFDSTQSIEQESREIPLVGSFFTRNFCEERKSRLLKSNENGYSFHLSFIAAGVSCRYVYSASREGRIRGYERQTFLFDQHVCQVQQFNIMPTESN